MLGDSRRWIGLALVAVAVFVASVLLSGRAALAHGVHASSQHEVVVQTQAEHMTSGEKTHCHGGAFCNGPAIILLSYVDPVQKMRSESYSIAHATTAIPVASSFDPPPPRLLI